MAWDDPKWGREGLFPANPDHVDILGISNFDFDDFILFFYFLDPSPPEYYWLAVLGVGLTATVSMWHWPETLQIIHLLL